MDGGIMSCRALSRVATVLPCYTWPDAGSAFLGQTEAYAVRYNGGRVFVIQHLGPTCARHCAKIQDVAKPFFTRPEGSRKELVVKTTLAANRALQGRALEHVESSSDARQVE